MSIFFVAGDGFNLWGRGTEINLYASEDTRLSCNVSVDPKFPLSRLYDGFSSQETRLSSYTAPLISLYMQQIKNGELDSWTGAVPDEWTATGGVTETVVGGEVVGGSAAKITSDGSAQYIYQTITARPGEWFRLLGYMRGDGAGGGDSAIAELLVQEYGAWRLNSSGAWVSSANVFTENATSHVEKSIDFQLPSYEQCGFRQWITVQLILSCRQSAGRIAYYDRWRLVPLANGLTVHGHNHRQRASPTFRGDNNFFAGIGTEIAAFNLPESRPTQWARASAMQNYWSYAWYKPGGQPASLGYPMIGESVLCQLAELIDTPPKGGVRISGGTPQMRSGDLLGEQRVYQTGSGMPQRVLTMDFEQFSDAAFNQLYDELVRRSHFGVHPCLVVFNSDDPRSALYGRLAPTHDVQVEDRWAWRFSTIEIVEQPFPTVIA